MKISSEILAARAINACRKLHLPTYVATRILLNSVISSKQSSWIQQTIPRKHSVLSSESYMRSSRFKKIEPGNGIEYREFQIPSPTALLSEALVLRYFSESKEFKKSSRVYSYLWPESEESPFNYEHYISGYKRRNIDIANYLYKNPEKVVLISDIEKFYPSIPQDKLNQKLTAKLHASDLPPDIIDLALSLFNAVSIRNNDGIGIFTGPEFSHLCGDLILDEIDASLEKQFGEAYFRYVDDIILIVDKKDLEKTKNLLSLLLSHENLTIHPDKTEEVPGHFWLSNGPHINTNVTSGSFEALVFKIKAFLSMRPTRQKSLEQLLNESNIFLPIYSIANSSQNHEFRNKLKQLYSTGWKVAIKALFTDEEDILEDAIELKTRINDELLTLLSQLIPLSPAIHKKWHIQKLRYFLNRAVYLLDLPQLELIMTKIQHITELVENYSLIEALIYGDSSKLSDLPGPAATAFGSLMYSRQRYVSKNTVEISNNDSLHVTESNAVFALWNLIDIKTDSLTPDMGLGAYLSFCQAKKANRVNKEKFTYIDEIACLSDSVNRSEIVNILQSRFSDSEENVLDALSIGHEYEYNN